MRQVMLQLGGTRAGSASRSVLLLVLLAGVILVALAVLLKDASPTSPAEAIPGLADGSTQTTEVALSTSPDAPRSSLDGNALGSQAGGVPLGVRLAGAGRLEGRVVDRASGAGVPGVRVDLTPLPPAATTLAERILRLFNLGSEIPERVRPVAAVLSGEGGSFVFEGVRPGSWFLDARGPFHAPESAVRARVTPAGSGGPLDVHVRPGGRVIGHVIAPDGKPATAARVFLMGGPGRFLEDAASGDLRLFESDCDGQGAFAFDGVPAGGGYDLSASGDRFAVSHRLDVEVVAGQEANVEVQARAGGTIVGRVLGTRGTEVPEPLAGAHVAAVPRGLRDLLLVGDVIAATHCMTGADGSFAMHHVPPGEVDLAAVAPGHLPGLGGRAGVADLATATADDILLSPGTMIRGRTADPAGQPIAGVQVRWQPLRGIGGAVDDFSFAQYLTQAIPGFVFPTTDIDGRFEAGPMSGSQPYPLDFVKIGWKEVHEQVDEERAKAEITVVLHRGGSVAGVVVDAGTSEPVKSFTVSTAGVIDTQAGVPGRWNPFTGGQLFEDEAGRFRLESVEAGQAQLRVDSPGYAEGGIEVEVAEGETTRDVRIELHPGGTVRGIVVDGEDHPLAGAHVVAVSEDGDRPSARASRGPGSMMGDIDSMPSALMGYAAGLGLLAHREAVSDARGHFELAGVEAGDLHLRAFHREQAWGTSPKITMPAGGTIEGVRVEMHLGGGVEGTVSDRYGRPVASDVVLALAPMALGGMGNDRAMGALYQGFTNARGAYRISHMAAGSYFLVVTRGDEALNPMSFLGRLNFDMVTVPEGQVVKYDLVDTTSGGCRVTGVLLDSGRPVAEGMLQALGFEGGGALGIDMKMARLSGDGRFEFPGLAPGRWQLTLQDAEGPDVRMLLDVPDQPEYRVDLSLPEGGLEGSVIDGGTSEPVAEADVTVRALGAPKIKGLLSLAMRGETGSSRTQTGEQGLFRFGRLCEAEYEVSVRPPRGKDSGKKWAPAEPIVVRVREGRVERGCVLRLSPPLTLAGFVRGSSGEPLEGARVLLRRQDRAEARPERARTDANGRFEIGGLAPAVYLASATAKDHAGTTVRDIRVEGRDSQVEIRLQPGVVVTVRVFGSDGRPVAGARATLLRADAENAMEAADADRVLEGLFKGEGASDIEGRIEMGRFLPGDYRLEVQRGTSTVTRPRVRIGEDQGETELRADLP